MQTVIGEPDRGKKVVQVRGRWAASGAGGEVAARSGVASTGLGACGTGSRGDRSTSLWISICGPAGLGCTTVAGGAGLGTVGAELEGSWERGRSCVLSTFSSHSISCTPWSPVQPDTSAPRQGEAPARIPPRRENTATARIGISTERIHEPNSHLSATSDSPPRMTRLLVRIKEEKPGWDS